MDPPCHRYQFHEDGQQPQKSKFDRIIELVQLETKESSGAKIIREYYNHPALNILSAIFALAIAVIGGVYLNNCPISNKNITPLLLSTGLVIFFLHFYDFITKKVEFCHGNRKLRRFVANATFAQYFLTIFMAYFVYPVYPSVVYDIANNTHYCHKVVYLSAFWWTTIKLIFMSIWFACCLACFVACCGVILSVMRE